MQQLISVDFFFFNGAVSLTGLRQLSCALIQTLGLAYGALNVQRLDILLAFLVQ